MSVKLNTRQVGDVTVIDVSGRITLGEGSSALRDALRELTAKGNKKILLNLGDVSYIDSSGYRGTGFRLYHGRQSGGHPQIAEPHQTGEGFVADYETLHRVRRSRGRSARNPQLRLAGTELGFGDYPPPTN